MLAAVLALGSLCASAETATYRFDIPEQTADRSLTLLAQQAKVPLLFSFDEVHEVTTAAVVGEYTLEVALERMLARTRLQGEVNKHGVLTVVTRPSDALVEGGTMKSSRYEIGSAAKRSGILGILAAVFSAGAGAQEPVDEDEAEQELEEIVVTGSRIRGAQSASPVITITRAEVDRAGLATVEEIVDRLPQNFGAGATQDTFTDPNSAEVLGGEVANIGAGTSVNLRGLGATATLILVNGRRISSSGATARFTDISGIPVSAIDRVEVLTDGASAIYGADAIGGVVNFVLRDDYEGAETRLRYGSDSGGDTSSVLFGQAFGTSWENGSVLFSYEYYQHDKLANTARPLTASTDLRPFGGTDWRALGGNPANIIAGGQIWAIPEGQDGTSLTPADFPVDADGVPIAPPSRYSDTTIGSVLPEQERHSGYLRFSQEIGSAELFAEARYSTRDYVTNTDPGVINVVILGDDPSTPETEGNPFFVDPTGTGLTSVSVAGYSLVDDFGPSTRFGGADHYGAVFGVNFDIVGDLRGGLVGNWAKEDSNDWIDNFYADTTFGDSLNQTNPDQAFNPFGDGSNTNPDLLDAIRASAIDLPINDAENILQSLGLHVDGKIFEISGGHAQLATGVEYREESIELVLDPGPEQEVNELDRGVLAVYSELFLPLVGNSNSRPGLRRLEVSLAARYEDYSDFGSSTDPKFGVVWSPSESITLRGTWGTSFRAPSLNQLDTGNLGLNSFVYLPEIPFVLTGVVPVPTLVLVGGNEDLKAEKATTWTAGFQWDPENVEGLSLDVTYFNVDFDDRIDLPAVGVSAVFNDPRFAPLLTLNPSNEHVTGLVTDRRFDDRFGISADDILLFDGTAPVGAIVDVRRTNLSRSVVTGVEFHLSYGTDTAFGAVNVGLNGSYLFDFKRQFISTDPLLEEIDTIHRPIDFRARGNVTVTRQAWSITGFINYADEYTDNVSSPSRPIGSLTTLDLTLAYDTAQANIDGLLGDTSVSLTVQNVFDEQPPFADTDGGLGYDSSNHNILGRFLSVQFTKEW